MTFVIRAVAKFTSICVFIFKLLVHNFLEKTFKPGNVPSIFSQLVLKHLNNSQKIYFTMHFTL